MSEIPETRFAPHGDSYIAYQVLGQGPPDIVFLRSAWNHVEPQWEDPRMARLLTRLASIGRLIVFDPRGSGLSDAFLEGGISTVEDWADDTLSVMDAVGSDRAAVVCNGGGTTRANSWVNGLQVWATGTVDLAEQVIGIRGYSA